MIPASRHCASGFTSHGRWAVFAALALGQSTHAQICPRTEVAKLAPATSVSSSTDFATRVAVSGDWIVVSETGQSTTTPNAVHVYRFADGAWSPFQTLAPPNGDTTRQFGHAIAVDDDMILVGAPTASLNGVIYGGVVHVFTFANDSWVHQDAFTSSEAQSNDQFGYALALDGDTLLVGATTVEDIFPPFNLGAVYVFRYDGREWVEQQRLVGPDSLSSDRFGTTIAMSGSAAVIGVPFHDGLGASSGAAYVFRFDGQEWKFDQKLFAFDGMEGDLFGSAVAISGDRVAIGAPNRGVPAALSGAVYCYTFDGTSWTGPQRLVTHAQDQPQQFGASLAMYGDRLIVGAPLKDVQYFTQHDAPKAGVAYDFRLDGDEWVERFELQQQYIPQDYDEPLVADDHLGTSAAMSDRWIVVGATMPYPNWPQNQYGAALVFEWDDPDCNANGVPDQCDADCNNNLIVDECEIQRGLARDCNANGLPDDCDNCHDYMLDNGMPWAVLYFPACPGSDMICLNQFNAATDGETITHIALPWVSFTPAGTPFTLLIYRDPDNDGNPDDAQLVRWQTASTVDKFGLEVPVHFVHYAVEPTYVGPVGQTFFVGFHMRMPCGLAAPMYETSEPLYRRSWRAISPLDEGNIYDLSDSTTLILQNGDWTIRALALDCNGNGQWDSCDIAGGLSADEDGNGAPDECLTPCSTDIDRSGAVDVFDLLAVASNWGSPGTQGEDVNGDGMVNFADMMALIATWGPCI